MLICWRSTSPSAYIAFPTISAADMCDTVGNVYTDITLAVASGQLSTVVGYSTFEFDFADALCPPASVAEVNHISFIGQGYRPVIAPFPGITHIDPQWISCGAADFQGNDPPSALVPKNGLSPFTTPSDAPAKPTAASPSSGVPAIPAQTSRAAVTTKTESPLPEPKSSTDPGSSGPVQSPSQSTLAQSNAAPDAPTQTTVSEDSSDPTRFSSPVTATPVEPAGSSPNDLVSQAIQTATATGDPSSNAQNPAVISIAGQSFTLISGSALVAGTVTLTAGGPAVTISDTPLSLAPSASFLDVAAGSSTINLDRPVITPSNVETFTFDGQTFTVNSASDLVVGGQTLTRGVEAFTFGGQTYTANSASDFVIGSQTLTRGASAIIISGTPVSLASVGTDVVIGSSTQGVGDLIMSGFAGGNPANLTVIPFLGAATRGPDSCMQLMLLMTGNIILGILSRYWI